MNAQSLSSSTTVHPSDVSFSSSKTTSEVATPLPETRPSSVLALPQGVSLRRTTASDIDDVEALTAKVFGPGRFARTAYRLREGNAPDLDCCHICEVENRLVASVVFSPIMIGDTPALLLGPLAVEQAWKNQGLGLALMQAGVDAAARARTEGSAAAEQGKDQAAGTGRLAELVILVGDLPYYARAAFVPVPPGQMIMPGPVDPARLLALELVDGALDRARGAVRPG
jgi:predicted N-acetyltransferase YhbS